MKTLLLALVLAFGSSALTAAEVPVKLEISGMLADASFSLGSENADPSGEYVFSVSRLSYYISEVTLIHDGGQRTKCLDAYFLVHAADKNVLDLGVRDVEVIEGLEFSIGVDQISNHKDPAQYPPGHPLALQNPSMHWGWSAGYRFCTFEGYAGPAQPTEKFEVHSVGNDLYHAVTLTDVGARYGDATITIPLVADYTNLLTNIAAQWGSVLVHGDFGEAVTMMVNFRDQVFTPSIVTSVTEQSPMNVQIVPNPTTNILHVSGLEPVPTMVYVSNNAGSRVVTAETTSGEVEIATSSLPSGTYFLTLVQGDRTKSVAIQVVR